MSPSWKDACRALTLQCIDLSVQVMRSAHTPADGGIVGDPYARGYLESVDACRVAVTTLEADTPEAFTTAILQACVAQENAMPAYVRRGPGDTWLPGSPYDQGKVDGAVMVKALFA